MIGILCAFTDFLTIYNWRLEAKSAVAVCIKEIDAKTNSDWTNVIDRTTVVKMKEIWKKATRGGFESYLLSRLSWCRNPLNLALARHRTHQHTGELCNQRFWLILSMLCMWLEVIKRGPVFAQASHERLLAMFRQGESMQLAKSVSRGFGTTTTQMSTCMLLGLLKKVVSSFALFCSLLLYPHLALLAVVLIINTLIVLLRGFWLP
ncbi:hypothetical protein QYF36_016696 [Acer negundo]|nr:hypothetical protein QYF36_016696 [Acer negundo]